MRKETVERAITLTCDSCGSTETLSEIKGTDWLLIKFDFRQGLLCLATDEKSPYFDLPTPSPIEETFCSVSCARKELNEKLDMFLAGYVAYRKKSSELNKAKRKLLSPQ
jgi:hypothetical protein